MPHITHLPTLYYLCRAHEPQAVFAKEMDASVADRMNAQLKRSKSPFCWIREDLLEVAGHCPLGGGFSSTAQTSVEKAPKLVFERDISSDTDCPFDTE